MNQEISYYRYQRQLLLKEFAKEGQDKLLKAKVLVVGAGGLGCPALQYITAAGTGTIGIVDFDIVDITNLHRQVLYTTEDIGKAKATTAADKLKKQNPDVSFLPYTVQLQRGNALEIISNFDLVIDGSDNFSTRYLVNDACVLLDKPLVYGAVLRFEGQVGVFNLSDKERNIKTNYRDLFPIPPAPGSTPSCSEAGVLGVLPGMIGVMQATECIKIITGIGKPLSNTILSYNCLSNQFYEFAVSPNEKDHSLIPKTKNEFLNFDYDWFCGTGRNSNEISCREFDTMRMEKDITIIDVREKDELPLVTEFRHTQIPLSTFEEALPGISVNGKIIIFCQTGKRSLKAVKMLMEKYPGVNARSLEGGVEAWKKKLVNPTLS